MTTIRRIDDFGSEPPDDFHIGERIGRPLPTRRGKALRRAIVVTAVGALGYAAYREPAFWSFIASTVVNSVSSVVDNGKTADRKLDESAGRPPESAPVATAAAEPPAPVAPAPVKAELPAVGHPAPLAEKPVAPPAAPVVAKPPTETDEEKENARITAMRPAETDPLRRRAEAAGLHPDLPRATLQRLSDGDFKSAAYAVRKALLSADDGAVVIWPTKPSAEAAQYRVSFVEGAGPSCRRYVVAIAKDGWQTTALPVETCGPKPALRATK